MTATQNDPFAELRFSVRLGTVAYRTEQGIRHDTKHLGAIAWRDDTGAPLALVGPAQTVVQPEVSVGVFEQLVARGHILPHAVRAYAWAGGARIAIIGETGKEGTVKTRRGEQPIRHRLFLYDRFDGTASLRVGSAEYVVVCSNGMVRLQHSTRARLRHTKSINERFADVVIALRRELDGFEQQIAVAQKLADSPLNDTGFKAILDEWFPRDENGERSVRAQNQLDRVERIYHTAPGADPGSLWGAYQAATYWLTHERGRESSRDEQNLVGVGADVNREILSGLVARAERAAAL